MEKLPSVETHSPEKIAAHHGVPVETILRQLEMGIEIEKEHTEDEATAREIALDHLLELPDYYTRLVKMEESEIADLKRRAGIAEGWFGKQEMPDLEGLLGQFEKDLDLSYRNSYAGKPCDTQHTERMLETWGRIKGIVSQVLA